MSGHSTKRHILLISIHGLIRGDNLELGRDADTGGQTKYVVDLARHLIEHPDVDRVDLVTRLVKDKNVSDDYHIPVEPLADNCHIVRIPDSLDEYLAKEELWDYLDTFLDNLINWLNQHNLKPDVVHSHYADAGYVGLRLSHFFGIPLVHTGHSLGRDKRKRLLAKGFSKQEIEDTYNMARRIDAEEETLANADLIITSTHNEIEEQYGLYSYYDPGRMKVIPPGTDLELFYPPNPGDRFSFDDMVDPFLRDPNKPFILALSRPDERKNIIKLIEAYGKTPKLQEKANLMIVAGSREDIRDMESGAQQVFENILLHIDLYNLYGSVAIPKKHKASDVPMIYRMTAASRGVFINPALTEPFGLTLLEAAASGIPLVATENGGPVDIIKNCECGQLIDPLDSEQIAEALLHFLLDSDAWQCASEKGIRAVRQHYSWHAHVATYVEALSSLEAKQKAEPATEPPRKEVQHRERAIFSDLDQNLLGDSDALQRFLQILEDNRKCVSFGIATGRRVDSALALMRKRGIPRPDILISSQGTRIQYGRQLTEDTAWLNHIDHHWTPRKIKRLLSDLPGLKRQPRHEQTQYKISWYYDAGEAPSVESIIDLLRHHEITANVILSFGQFLDVVPARASKGKALRYVAQRLSIPLEHTLVAGGSGADEDMMRGNTMAVVVGNRHNEELSQLDIRDAVYFAKEPYAAGIIEAIDHYDFFNACRLEVLG